MNWQLVTEAMQAQLNEPIHLDKAQLVGEGNISQAWKVGDQQGRQWLVKSNHKHLLPMFKAESKGLKEIADSRTLRVPTPLCNGVAEHHAFLVMEYIQLHGSPSAELLAEKLAAMHHTTRSHFGWRQSNTIGSTPQHNPSYSDWIDFWRYERLEYQLTLAKQKGFSVTAFTQGMQLASQLSCFFSDYKPQASLLHGDLWSGNYSADKQGQPVIYDPAIYYGDHEADLAMMELFGNPGKRFFSAYNEHFAIDMGYQTRKMLYNLYHILNHFNLFGGSYASQAQNMINQLLAET
jgi:fructosamine-3-kinase